MPDSTVRDTSKPVLITDDAALDRYLADVQRGAYGTRRMPAGVELADWLASGDDACERCYMHARRPGRTYPLVRLPEVVAPIPSVAKPCCRPPRLARQLRVVPLRAAHGGLLAVAMEDPSDSEALAAVEFVTTNRVVPLMGSARGIRAAIARSYDLAEDRETARRLGLDPLASIDASEAEAQRLAREQPVVRLVHGLIADAVARRASDIHLRPGEDGDRGPVPDRRRTGSGAQPAARPARRGGEPDQGARRHEPGRAPARAGRPHQLHRWRTAPRSTCASRCCRQCSARASVVRLLDTRESLWTLEQLGLAEADRLRIDDVMSAQPRHVPGDRADRLRQVHDPVRDAAGIAPAADQHPHHRGSGRIPHPGDPADAGQPRGGLHLLQRDAQLPAPRPGRDHGRRDTRPRDRRHRGGKRAHRPPAAQHAAYQYRRDRPSPACSTWASRPTCCAPACSR
jgi:hypothetical protein